MSLFIYAYISFSVKSLHNPCHIVYPNLLCFHKNDNVSLFPPVLFTLKLYYMGDFVRIVYIVLWKSALINGAVCSPKYIGIYIDQYFPPVPIGVRLVPSVLCLLP